MFIHTIVSRFCVVLCCLVLCKKDMNENDYLTIQEINLTGLEYIFIRSTCPVKIFIFIHTCFIFVNMNTIYIPLLYLHLIIR